MYMYIYVYICVQICIHVCTYICVYVHVHICIHMYTNMYTCMYIYMRVCTSKIYIHQSTLQLRIRACRAHAHDSTHGRTGVAGALRCRGAMFSKVVLLQGERRIFIYV